MDRYSFFKAVKADLDRRIADRQKTLADLECYAEQVGFAVMQLTSLGTLVDAVNQLPEFYRVEWTEDSEIHYIIVEGRKELDAERAKLDSLGARVRNTWYKELPL